MKTLNQYISEKRKSLVTESTETKIASITEESNTESSDVKVLEGLIKNLSIVHLILTKNLINESATDVTINAAVCKVFGDEKFFKDEDEIDSFYTDTMKEMCEFLTNEGFFSKENKEGKEKLSKQFDELNTKLVGTKGDQTKNKDKWMERAKKEDDFNGSFKVDRGVLQYDSKSKNPLQGVTGGSSGYGTAN